MSLGLFGVVLVGVLVVLSLDRGSRLRTVVTGVVGLMLGLVIAGSDGILVEPAHHLVDSVRAGLTAVADQLDGTDPQDRGPAPSSHQVGDGSMVPGEKVLSGTQFVSPVATGERIR